MGIVEWPLKKVLQVMILGKPWTWRRCLSGRKLPLDGRVMYTDGKHCRTAWNVIHMLQSFAHKTRSCFVQTDDILRPLPRKTQKDTTRRSVWTKKWWGKGSKESAALVSPFDELSCPDGWKFNYHLACVIFCVFPSEFAGSGICFTASVAFWCICSDSSVFPLELRWHVAGQPQIYTNLLFVSNP